MSERHVVVVGSGAAGTAAALAARAAGARVTMVRGKTGATSLGCGAIDDALDDATRTVVGALELFSLVRATLPTSAGTLRAVHGSDLSLANLDASKGAVLVARVAHASWDASSLAAAFAEHDTRGFVARDVGLVAHTNERAMNHIELAALHDEPARLALAAERIKNALAQGGTFGSVLLPPWLGISAPRAAALSALVGVPCGEVLVPFDGPAGPRFERARDRCLQNATIEARAGRVKRVASNDAGCTIETHDDTLAADAVILATGGVLAGGIEYAPDAPFRLSYDAPVVLGAHGRALVVPGSVFGLAPESLTWPHANPPLLESVGVLVDGRLRARERVFVCGDALEGLPRTLSSAFSTGTVAGQASAA